VSTGLEEVHELVDSIRFASRADFRAWLAENGMSSGGVWLLFGKPGGPKTLKASEALEEALCFGWIDGQMQSIDSGSYVKYFARRRKNSKWSPKNKALVQALEEQGLMTDHGRAKIEEAKRNGQWDAPAPPATTDADVDALCALLGEHKQAQTNFLAMPPSVRATYARAYVSAKTPAGRSTRLVWIVERLNKNLRPM